MFGRSLICHFHREWLSTSAMPDSPSPQETLWSPSFVWRTDSGVPSLTVKVGVVYTGVNMSVIFLETESGVLSLTVKVAVVYTGINII